MKKIAFIENKLTPRGSSVTLYNMAKYNELILNNESIIITRPYDLVKKISPMDVTEEAYLHFEKKFKMFYYNIPSEIDSILKQNNIDLAFIEKAGSSSDGLLVNYCKSFIHVVFDTDDKHGDYYCPISDFVNKICGTSYKVLPYMLEVYDTKEDLREELNIPKDSLVFGTYSGKDCFNIQYIKDAVINSDKNIYFIFMNINQFCDSKENIIFLEGTCDLKMKRKFINTCDAMLYGRDGGETFGLACGEFSLCDKPVICRSNERCTSHLDILGDDAILHNNYTELLDIIHNFKTKYNKSVVNNNFKNYTPEKVMNIFLDIISN